MSARLARLALALYPLAYRRRYGEEMAALVEDSGASPRAVADLLRGAARAHLRPEPAVAGEVCRADRLRLGASAVLLCWVLFTAAIFGLAKTTEEAPFHAAVEAHAVLGGAHLAMQVLSIGAWAALLLGALPLLAVALGSLRTRPAVRRAALLAAGWLLVFVAATGGVVLLAHGHPRVGSGVVDAALVAWAAVGLCCAAGCALAARRGLFASPVPAALLRLAMGCAAVVAGAMVGIAIATAVYLVALLESAPDLAAAANGPGGLLSVGASLGLVLVAMVPTAAAASIDVRRAYAP